MLSDLRYALRALRHKPGFTLTAILSIALGIGANAAIFSFADGLLLRPLPVPNAAQVVTLKSKMPSGPFGPMSWQDYIDFRDRAQSFNGLIAFELGRFGFAHDTHAQPQIKGGFLVSGNFFRVLDTEPRFGRGFREDENRIPGRDAVAVLGHDFWKTEFASNPSVIGRHIWLNSLEFEVIGVAPESFTGMDQFIRPSFFVPAMMGPKLLASNRDLLTDRNQRAFTTKGRLKPGVTVRAADAEAGALARTLEQSNPAINHSFGATVRTERQIRLALYPGTGVTVIMLFTIVAVVLAIACANVANLVLGRGRSRSREIAVRLAIGASRARLVTQLMTESVLIALAGGLLGLLIAQFFVEVASSAIQIPGDPPIQLTFQLDERVLWFTVVVSMWSAIMFGLVPALKSTKTDLVPALKTGEAEQARKRLFGRSALVVMQVAGSLVLLVIAAQLFRSLSRMMGQNPGFRTDHVLMMGFDPSFIRYTPPQTEQFYKTLVDKARAVPGVESVTLASQLPLSTNPKWSTVIPEGYQFPRGQDSASVMASTVDRNYFETLGVQILRGRGFLDTDRANAPLVAVVNDAFARHYMDGNPIGKRLRLNDKNGPPIEIVGVTPTGKYLAVNEAPTDFVYLPLGQHGQPEMTLVVRTHGDPAALAAPMRETARSIDAHVPVFGVHTMSDFLEQRSVKITDLIVGTVGTIGMVGLALALVGLYAVVAYQVASRTREIGIRMAIGADRVRVMNMILKQAAVMCVAGVAIGMVLSVAASRALDKTAAFDPLLFSLVSMGLLLTTFLASAIPARRASRVDPMEALRQE